MHNSAPREEGFVTINNAQLYYEMAGTGHPLILSHAGIADSRMWDEQFDVFAQRFRVLRYDLRGFGKSEIPPAPYSLSNDLFQLI